MAITSNDVADMVRHWLSTPVNGYLGSSYGSDPLSLLQLPNSDGIGDAFIDKMLFDLPVLKQMARGTINVFYETTSKDTKRLLIQVGEVTIPYEEIET